MVGNVIDRGGEVAVDTVPPSEQDTPVARSGGWGNIAFIGAGIGLLGALGGIAIGYGAFHRTAVTTTAAQPAKASERSVEDVMNSPNAQRAALAGQLGQTGAPATDVFGRPIAGAPGQTTVDANGNTVVAPQGTRRCSGVGLPFDATARRASSSDGRRRTAIAHHGVRQHVFCHRSG